MFWYLCSKLKAWPSESQSKRMPLRSYKVGQQAQGHIRSFAFSIYHTTHTYTYIIHTLQTWYIIRLCKCFAIFSVFSKHY